MIAGRLEQATWLMAEIDHRREWWAAERHPVYARWSAGELTGDDLRTYAAEHYHVAAALAGVTHRAAGLAEGLLRAELTREARERDDELEMWCEFAVAAGWPRSAGWWFGADPYVLLRQAEVSYRAYWELLDGVSRLVIASG